MASPLVQLLIAELPELIRWLKERFKDKNPDLPQPTSEEVLAAFHDLRASTLAIDEQWLAAHPEEHPG